MLEIRGDHNGHIVCIFGRGPKVTYYLGVEGGPCLDTCQMPTDRFERAYSKVPQRADFSLYTGEEFARAYMKDEAARSAVPISSTAFRVMSAILKGQQAEGNPDGADDINLENIMAAAKEEGGFRKPEGNVAKVHKYLDSKLDGIKAGTVSRKQCVDALAAKEIPVATITTQAGIWARTNGVSFARPAQAEEAKKAAKEKAAKKAARAKAKEEVAAV